MRAVHPSCWSLSSSSFQMEVVCAKAAQALLLLAPDRKRNLKCAVVQQLPSGRDFIQILSGYMRVCMWGKYYTLLLPVISTL